MDKPWLAENEVSEKLATELIREQFPELMPLTIKAMGSGWDNVAYLVNSKYIFRFPRRKIAVDLINYEMQLLPILVKKLPLDIPKPIFFGKPSEIFPWPFCGYQLLPGKTACNANLSHEQRIQNAAILGTFLRRLHEIDINQVKQFGAVNDEIERLNLAKRIPIVIERLQHARKLNYIHDLSSFLSFFEDIQQIKIPDIVSLVHGDFYVRHLILNSKNIVTGVIDWGDVHLGNPAIDISMAHSFLPPDAHCIFRDAYGEIDEAIWQLAKFKAIYSSTMIIVFGHDKNDQDLIREGQVGLRYCSF